MDQRKYPSLPEHFKCRVESTASASSPHLTILQWNVLAAELGDTDAFPLVSAKYLDLAHRLPLVVGYIDHPCIDIVVMEEMDYYGEIEGRVQGWGWIFGKKGDSRHGNLIGVRKDSDWAIVESQRIAFTNAESVNRLFMHVTVEHKNTKQRVHILGTHLKAKKKNFQIRDLESIQIAEYIKKLKTDSAAAIILCGDFNAEPAESSIENIKAAGLTKMVKSDTVHTTAKYHSPEDHHIRQIDYIFYSADKLAPVETWQESTLPVPKNLFPSADMPSDHLPIYGTFALIN